MDGLTVSAVASRIGVAPATLRTWDRRYGVGPSVHASGTHRRYSASDVERLERMRQFILSGYAPADAARMALADEAGVLSVDTPDAKVIPFSYRADTRGLARAANLLDPRACLTIISQSLVKHGVGFTWDSLVTPVMVGLGHRWESTGDGVDAEHVLSDSAVTAFTRYANTQSPTSPGIVLLASAEHDLHSLPLYATAAALAERGVRTTVLGARVPMGALSRAVTTLRPAGLLVWSSLAHPAPATNFDRLPNLRPAPVIVAAGPGWGEQVPDQVTRVMSMTQAVTVLTKAAGRGWDE